MGGASGRVSDVGRVDRSALPANGAAGGRASEKSAARRSAGVCQRSRRQHAGRVGGCALSDGGDFENAREIAQAIEEVDKTLCSLLSEIEEQGELVPDPVEFRDLLAARVFVELV